jgi:hypothetical protein
MAARKTKSLSEDWRQKIQTSMIINRLQDHIKGTVELSPTQVSAANILLKKIAPDLQAVEHSGEVETSYVARLPTASKTMDEWQASHANSLEPKTIQ